MPARRLRDGQEAFKSIPKRPKSTPKAPRRRPRGRPNHVPGTLSGNMIPHSRPGKGYRHFKMARDGPKMVQDVKGGTRAPKMAQDSCQDASTRPQDRPKAVPSVTTEFRAETHETPESLNNQKNIVMFALSSFRSLPSGHFRHKTDRTLPKRAPRGAQNGPRTAPRAPNSSRDGSKRAPGEPEEAQGSPETATEGVGRVRTPEDGPKSARDARRLPEKLP